MPNDLKNIVESLLFVADGPIDIRTFKQIIADANTEDIRQAVSDLMAEYDARQGGFLLHEVAGGFQFRTNPAYKEWVKRLVRPSPVRLSKAALETLAIIAYHQPIIRSDVEKIRGVDSGSILRGLLERKLIRILGKKEIPGRPLIYATTKRFLEVFNLKSLSDMPSLKEIQEFGKTDAAAAIAAEPAEQPDQAEDEPSSEQSAESTEVDDSAFPEQGMETPEADAAVPQEQVMEEPEDEATDPPSLGKDLNIPEANDSVSQDQGMEATEAEEADFPVQDTDYPEGDEAGEKSSEDE